MQDGNFQRYIYFPGSLLYFYFKRNLFVKNVKFDETLKSLNLKKYIAN